MAVYSENLCAMVVEFIKKEHTQKEESEVFGVSVRAISRWKKMYKKEKINLLRKSAKKAWGSKKSVENKEEKRETQPKK